MLFEQTTVGEFLQQTLVCHAKIPIQDILDLLQHPSESAASSAAQSDIGSAGDGSDLSQLVVVNEQQQPIGLIPLAQFIHWFVVQQHAAPSVSPQQPIAEWVNLHSYPLQCVSETDSLKQFWQYLQTFSQDVGLSWAIVEDTTGKYLGLLDAPKLVQFLAHHTPLSVAIKFSSDLKSTVTPALELSNTPPTLTDSSPLLDITSPRQPLSAELLAEVSHELKSPLTAILSLSNVLSHQGIQNLSERQLQYVQLIHQKSQQLMSIVNNLLDLTQLPTQAQPDPPQDVDLDLLCEDAIAQAKRYYLLEQGTSNPAALIIQRYPTRALGSLSSYELKLRQILVHLLHNALGLTQGQSPIELSVQQWQDWTIFTISDQGDSIPHLQQPLIFQIPQSWSNPDQDHLSKTGLGLILAQRLAEQLSGNISFISGPEQGNAFSLYVPPEPSRRQQTQFTQGLVLVIATNPVLIDQVHQHLSEQSLQVVIARSEAEIHQKIATLKPQAIILQILLATCSGWDMLSLLKQRDDSCPILLIGNTVDCQRAAEVGTADCLTLPALQPGLTQWLEKWLNAQVAPHVAGSKQASFPPSNSFKSQKLTVLHLDSNLEQTENAIPLDINQALYEHQWRVVSTTTLDEAELLANIWNPNVILYTADDPAPFLAMTSESPLTSFPFMILHPDVQRVALERGDLKVFSCSNLTTLPSLSELLEASFPLQIPNNITAAE